MKRLRWLLVDLASLRDIAVVVFAVLGAAASIVVIVIGVMFYRSVKPTLDSAKVTFNSMKGVSGLISDTVARPIIMVFSWLEGGRHAFAALAKRAKKEGRDEQ